MNFAERDRMLIKNLLQIWNRVFSLFYLSKKISISKDLLISLNVYKKLIYKEFFLLENILLVSLIFRFKQEMILIFSNVSI